MDPFQSRLSVMQKKAAERRALWHVEEAPQNVAPRIIASAGRQASSHVTAAPKALSQPVVGGIKTRSQLRKEAGGAVDALLKKESWDRPQGAIKMQQQIHAIDPVISQRLTGLIDQCYASIVADNSKGTYASAVKSLTKGFSSAEFNKLLPVRTPAQLVSLFAGRANGQWNTTKLYLSALATWHLQNNFPGFDGVRYDEQFVLFWKGLKNSSVKGGHEKRPVSIKEYRKFLDSLVYKKDGYVAMAGHRDAAMASVAFWGVKRISEVAKLRRSDIVYDEKRDGYNVTIRKQKQGNSTSCFLPFFRKNKKYCPASLLKKWIDTLEQTFEVSPESFIFVITKGKRSGQAISTQHFRNVMLDHFGGGEVSCHSLRKGGAQAWIELGASRGAVQRQGGWTCSATMDAIYLALSKVNTKDKLASLARA